MRHRTTFGPTELTAMSSAFAAALSGAAQEPATDFDIGAHTLRRCLAAGIVEAATRGIVDSEALAEHGLTTWRRFREQSSVTTAAPRPGLPSV